jgi:uncharacterized protein YecA (UPF0149 family)
MNPGVSAKSAKVGRNELCPCGSGKKYKRCCAEKEATLRASQFGERPLSLRAW